MVKPIQGLEVTAPFPMNIALDHLPKGDPYTSAVTYLDSDGLRRNDIPGMFESMVPVYEAIHRSMNGRKYFMSICPVPYNRPGWYYRQRIDGDYVTFSLDRICSLLERVIVALGINFKCRMEINIDPRRGAPVRYPIYFTVLTYAENGMYEPVYSDRMMGGDILIFPEHEAIAPLLEWFSDCHGMIAWDLDPSAQRQPFTIEDIDFLFLACRVPAGHGIYQYIQQQRMKEWVRHTPKLESM